jgi:hypothetical protein
MRRLAILALLTLALPALAGADTITNLFGTVSISAMAGTEGAGTIGVSTISTGRSTVTQFDKYVGHSLGYLSFSTGVLKSGSVLSGGTFNRGGSFDVVGSGQWVRRLTGEKGPLTMFAGKFISPIAWTLTSQVGRNVTYTLTGEIEGTNWTGREEILTTTQNIYTTTGLLSQGIGYLGVGHTTPNGPMQTPEPGTLGLLGTGLAGTVAIFLRKRIA